MDIETALADQVVVDHGVEIGVVDDVIDVPVMVIVQPAGRDLQKVEVVRAGLRSLLGSTLIHY